MKWPFVCSLPINKILTHPLRLDYHIRLLVCVGLYLSGRMFWFVQDMMSQSQDKAFQRMAELREQIQLNHVAKLDIENNYRMLLDDKDEMIKVLKTQVRRVMHKGFSIWITAAISYCLSLEITQLELCVLL